MKLNELYKDSIHPDEILTELCNAVMAGQRKNPKKYGMVAACVVDPDHKQTYGVNYLNDDNRRTHAERAAIESYESIHGSLPKGCIVFTTLSPCSEHMHDRTGESCTDLLNAKEIKRVYCGYIDPTQHESSYKKRQFDVRETNDTTIKEMCKTFASAFLDDLG